MIQSFLFGLKIITIAKLFRKYFKNSIEVKFYDEEKNMTADSCFNKIKKVFKREWGDPGGGVVASLTS